MESESATPASPVLIPALDQSRSILFASLGGAVLDEIRIGEHVITRDNLGGAGIHATVGARLFTPNSDRTVAWKLNAGQDFPIQIEETLRKWRICLELHRIPGAVSTRNVLTYHDSSMGAKTFRYLTPPTQLEPDMLAGTGMLSACAFHFHVASTLIRVQILELLNLLAIEGLGRPTILWEPTRPTCTPDNLQLCIDAARFVDVFSPNHDELAAMHGSPSADFDPTQIEQLSQQFLDSGIGPAGTGIIAVRAGEHGCLIQSRDIPPTWLPAFYEPHGASLNPSVIDTTGAGNAFLGGFAIGLLESGDPVTAAQYGSVASSYMVEQIGLPVVEYPEGGTELWNGSSVRGRLVQYQKRSLSCKTVGQSHDGSRPRSR